MEPGHSSGASRHARGGWELEREFQQSYGAAPQGWERQVQGWMQGEWKEEPRENGLSLPALVTAPLPTPLFPFFPLFLLPTLKNSLVLILSWSRRTALGTAEHGRWPGESREEPEESMESPRVLHGHLKAACAEQSNPPSLLLPQPKASPVLNTLICRPNQPCDSAITFSMTKTLLSCFVSLKFSFPQSLLFGNTKVELETPNQRKQNNSSLQRRFFNYQQNPLQPKTTEKTEGAARSVREKRRDPCMAEIPWGGAGERSRGGLGWAGLYLRTGCVLNSAGRLSSPTPLPLTADSLTA